MEKEQREINIKIGSRLRETRENLGYRQADFAAALQVTEEHYRKYELGSTGLSANKLLTLHRIYGIDPTFLITGKQVHDFDLEYFVTHCSKEQKERFIRRILAYLEHLLLH